MNDELFNELMESVREGGAILRGEIAPSRRRDVLRKWPDSLISFILGALRMKASVEPVRLLQEK